MNPALFPRPNVSLFNSRLCSPTHILFSTLSQDFIALTFFVRPSQQQQRQHHPGPVRVRPPPRRLRARGPLGPLLPLADVDVPLPVRAAAAAGKLPEAGGERQAAVDVRVVGLVL